MNGLLDEAAELTDTDDRAQAYGEVARRSHETNSIIYLYRERYLTAYTEDLAGVQVYADGVVHLSHAGFVAEEDDR